MSKRPPPWTLQDCINAHLEHPDTFEVPDAATIAALKPGDFVKLIFQRRKPRSGPFEINAERMWVQITALPGRDGLTFTGTLNNDPVIFSRCLKDGSPITFTARNIASTLAAAVAR